MNAPKCVRGIVLSFLARPSKGLALKTVATPPTFFHKKYSNYSCYNAGTSSVTTASIGTEDINDASPDVLEHSPTVVDTMPSGINFSLVNSKVVELAVSNRNYNKIKSVFEVIGDLCI